MFCLQILYLHSCTLSSSTGYVIKDVYFHNLYLFSENSEIIHLPNWNTENAALPPVLI